MNREIEARLERSLRSQISAPKLDGRFDAAVWARIQEETARAVAPVQAASASGASRWLFATNVIGVLIAAALTLIFGAQSLSGAEFQLAMPAVSPGFAARLIHAMIWPVTGVALAFGLMFTSFGRRLRSEFF